MKYRREQKYSDQRSSPSTYVTAEDVTEVVVEGDSRGRRRDVGAGVGDDEVGLAAAEAL